jgi:uncharacterized phage-associated protein
MGSERKEGAMAPFQLNVKKTIQAIGVLLRSLDLQQLEYISLLKLLYPADRESVRERGRPITGDMAVAMKNGPVLSGVYDLINFNLPRELGLWTTFLSRDEYDLVLNEDPGTDQLSRSEIRKLEEVARANAKRGWRELVRITHDLPEYQKNDPELFGMKLRPIPLKDIYEAVGRAEGMEELLEDAEAVTACQQLLKG